jgi:hypothetical protein
MSATFPAKVAAIVLSPAFAAATTVATVGGGTTTTVVELTIVFYQKPPAYQWQNQHENIYKSRQLGLITTNLQYLKCVMLVVGFLQLASW